MPRHILTGAPGAGKTCVLRSLEMAGHAVVEEAATDVIALEQAQGNQQPWSSPAFIDKVLALQRLRQVRASTAEHVFFDRSPVCTLALTRYLGYPPPPALAVEIERVVREACYERTVFFIKAQGFIHPTPARQISLQDSLHFERLHEETYRDLGFRLVDIPAAPVRHRAALIRQALMLAQHQRALAEGAVNLRGTRSRGQG